MDHRQQEGEALLLTQSISMRHAEAFFQVICLYFSSFKYMKSHTQYNAEILISDVFKPFFPAFWYSSCPSYFMIAE